VFNNGYLQITKYVMPVMIIFFSGPRKT